VLTNKNHQNFSPFKKILFYFILFLLPFIIFMVAKILFRVAGVGNDYPLVKQQSIYSLKRNIINRDIAKRYFSIEGRALPKPDAGSFEINKSANTYRVMCLGGSTTAGYPYGVNATFPFQLKARLQKIWPDRNIEVVNAGITAVNSYTVLDLLPEVIEQKPDMIILYMGHNEFYGAFGVGSTQYAGMNRSLVLTYLKLNRLRCFQVFQKLFQWVLGTKTSIPQKSTATLMEVMVREPSAQNSSDYVEIACNNFKKNLEDILDIALRAEVPVLVSTLVSNLKNHEPFVSVFTETTSSSAQKKWQELFLEARNLQMSGQHDRALFIFNQLEKIDAFPARLFFFRAISLENIGLTQQAYNDYLQARNLDQLKFRAPSVFNDFIKNVARQKDVPVVDMDAVFCAASSDGIPGNNLFHEHLHPNFNGQKLMAETFFEAILTYETTGALPNKSIEKPLLSKKSIQDIIVRYEQEQGNITSLDMEFGNFKNFLLTRQWPFPEKEVSINDYQPLGSTYTRDLAISYVSNKITWDNAHIKLAEYYLSKGDRKSALAEYMAVYTALPEIQSVPIMITDFLIEGKKLREALDFCSKAVETSPNNSLLMVKKALILISLKKYNDSILQLNRAREVEVKSAIMNTDQKAYLYYLLAICYSNLRKVEEAKNNIEISLKLKPDNKPAISLQSQLTHR
jgi:tetratricopeptide (TPR) repeat protein